MNHVFSFQKEKLKCSRQRSSLAQDLEISLCSLHGTCSLLQKRRCTPRIAQWVLNSGTLSTPMCAPTPPPGTITAP